MSKGWVHGGTGPGLSTQLVLSTCPRILWQLINDPRTGVMSFLVAQSARSVLMAQVEWVVEEALG